jgi:hypothetical protein
MAIKRNRSYKDVAPREVRDLVKALKDKGRDLKMSDPVWWVGHLDERADRPRNGSSKKR